MKQTRLSWDEYFMDVARVVATRSTCDRAMVGAVIVKDRHILTTGYNGSPRGLPHCDEVGHLIVDDHCVRTVHAECNSIIQAALHGVSTKGTTMYATHLPCLLCAKMIVNAGVVRVIYETEYRNQHIEEFFAQAGVVLLELKPKVEQVGQLPPTKSRELVAMQAPVDQLQPGVAMLLIGLR